MILNRYIRSRIIFILLIFTLLPIGYLFWGGDHVTSQHEITQKKSFEKSLKNYCLTQNITLHELIYPTFNYTLFRYYPIWLIGEQNGIKELFYGRVRIAQDGQLINIKAFKKVSQTPLADETHLKKYGDYILYKSVFKQRETIHIIADNKIYHLTMKQNSPVSVTLEKKMLHLNGEAIKVGLFQENPYYYFYETSLDTMGSSPLNHYIFPKNPILKTNLLKQFSNSDLKESAYPKINRDFILDAKTLSKSDLSINYLKLQIPNQPPLESYIFNKKKFLFNIATSGSYLLSRTGQVVNRLTTIHNTFSFDFSVKGGLKMDEIILRPLIINMPTLLINGKNHLIYGPGTTKKYPGDDYLQSPFPLIDHNKQSVLIENLKQIDQKTAKEKRARSGLCFKNEQIFFFWGSLPRSVLMEYMYLLKCDYAFETNSTQFSYNKPMVPGRVNILLTDKKMVSDQLPFKEKNGIFQYEMPGITIYRIPCNLLNFDYLPGRDDPISNNLVKLNRELVVDDAIKYALLNGAPDHIYPDGLFFERKAYYKSQNKAAFYLKRDRCNIGRNTQNSHFFKEGKVIFHNQMSALPQKERYKNARLGVGVKSDMVYLFQLKQSNKIDQVIALMRQLKIETGMLFENSSPDQNPLTGSKLILKIKRDQREIYPLKQY